MDEKLDIDTRLPSYRRILRTLLDERKVHNKRYSLRALSRDAGMPASEMSRILSGKKSMAMKTAIRVLSSIHFDDELTNEFLDAVNLEQKALALLKISQNRKESD